jgi:uncharacterized protein YndB with AHSA1/START domain
VRIEREVEIARPIEEVFAFVADARNDPRWCPKVKSVEGSEPGAGARYDVVHKPVPLKPERRMEVRCVRFEPPHSIELREDDGTDVFTVVYELSDAGDGRTRMCQRSDAEIGAPRLLHPLFKAGIGRDLERQLRELKKLLEGGADRQSRKGA